MTRKSAMVPILVCWVLGTAAWASEPRDTRTVIVKGGHMHALRGGGGRVEYPGGSREVTLPPHGWKLFIDAARTDAVACNDSDECKRAAGDVCEDQGQAKPELVTLRQDDFCADGTRGGTCEANCPSSSTSVLIVCGCDDMVMRVIDGPDVGIIDDMDPTGLDEEDTRREPERRRERQDD